MTRRLRRVEVNRNDFHQIVTDRNGGTCVSLIARYTPDHCNVRDAHGHRFRFIGNIYCISRVTCAVGVSYENNVNNAREKRGARRNFRQSGEPWGPAFRHANDAAIIENIRDHRRYLQVRVIQREYDYRRRDNNHRIPEAVIRRFRTEETNTEGVVLRRYRFDHLVEVVMRQASESESKRYILTD